MPATELDQVVNLCKRRGFVFPSAEIYGGFRSTYDYGPLGVLLLRNVKDAWWRSMVQLRGDIVGLDAAILSPPAVWEASGHLKNFTDPLVDCKVCHQRFRLDKLDDPHTCPNCGARDSFTEARQFNLMFKTHAPSLLAFTNPTVNSFHRLVPGFEAPISLVYSSRNRSASVRIPITGANPKAKRVETRFPDPSANPYLAFAALMLAGLDGVQNKTEPAAPIDKDIYELPPDEMAEIDQVPTSLGAVLDALEADHEYLTAGGVFTDDLIETWIHFKRTQEIAPVQLRPHPHEFELYYDI